MTTQVSVAQCVNALHDRSAAEHLGMLLGAMQKDIAALNAAYAATLLKLDADAGVTDVNYHSLAATLAPTMRSKA